MLTRIKKKMQNLEEVQNWFTDNRLKMSTNKTQYLTVFTVKHTKLQPQKVIFHYIIFSETLSLSCQISKIKKKVKLLFTLKMIRQHTKYDMARIIYFSNFQNVPFMA